MESYELAWAEALAYEHTHQHELLATLHDELGSFAGECAAALTVLDDLSGVSGLLDVAKTGSRNAALVRDIAQRLPGLARTDALRDEQLSGFYTHLAGEANLSQALVHQAGELIRADPKRADWMLLRAIVDAAGERSVIRHVVGPGAGAALNALNPMADWAPALARLGGEGKGGRGKLVVAARKDLTVILESTAAATGQAIGADSIALPDSFRDTVEHVEQAAHAIAEGQLETAIAETRRHLEASLDELRAVHRQAKHAPHAWHAAKEIEGAALVNEVRETLEKVEKIRRALGVILPHLRVTARALGTIEKLRSLEGQLDAPSAAGIEAARMSLLLAVAAAFEASLPESRHPVIAAGLPIRKRWLVGAAVVLVAVPLAIALDLTGGSKNAARPNTILNVTPTNGIPAAPQVSPLHARFDPAQRATFYSLSVHASHQGTPHYAWHLTPPKNNLSCNKFGSVFGSPNRAVWHHSDTDGCTHFGVTGLQHPGTVTVTITTRYWECTTSFFGMLTANGAAPKACKRV